MEQTEPPAPGRRSPWRFGVPLVCLLAGLLLAATHGVSGGKEIRRGDAPGWWTWSAAPRAPSKG